MAIQNIAQAQSKPIPPQTIYERWYQSYFNTPQGCIGLEENRREFCRFLWRLWSPNWHFSNEAYEKTATSFDNPDFVETVIQSYRHCYANAPGDSALAALEEQLAEQPKIVTPTVVFHGAEDQVKPPEATAAHEDHFTADYRREILPGVGHCVPAEAPPFSQAIESLIASSHL